MSIMPPPGVSPAFGFPPPLAPPPPAPGGIIELNNDLDQGQVLTTCVLGLNHTAVRVGACVHCHCTGARSRGRAQRPHARPSCVSQACIHIHWWTRILHRLFGGEEVGQDLSNPPGALQTPRAPLCEEPAARGICHRPKASSALPVDMAAHSIWKM